jgi:hypothetical protein
MLDTVNPKVDFAALADTYRGASPFPHIVIDEFLQPQVAERLAGVFPAADAAFWHEYNNPIEKKLACNMREHMPAPIGAALDALNGEAFRQALTILTGIADLKDDPGLHGGGMHCIRPGGKLDVHIDYAIHPKLKLERRLNLLVYLTPGWKEKFGGFLELWDSTMTRCVERVLPAFNRAVIFDTGDGSYHGHPEPLACPPNWARRSIALYYLTEPRPGVTERYRARFVARPQDPKDEALEEFRRQRSGLDTGPGLWRSEGQKPS